MNKNINEINFSGVCCASVVSGETVDSFHVEIQGVDTTKNLDLSFDELRALSRVLNLAMEKLTRKE